MERNIESIEMPFRIAHVALPNLNARLSHINLHKILFSFSTQSHQHTPKPIVYFARCLADSALDVYRTRKWIVVLHSYLGSCLCRFFVVLVSRMKNKCVKMKPKDTSDTDTEDFIALWLNSDCLLSIFR